MSGLEADRPSPKNVLETDNLALHIDRPAPEMYDIAIFVCSCPDKKWFVFNENAEWVIFVSSVSSNTLMPWTPTMERRQYQKQQKRTE